jgi:hypothetical protein
MRILVLALALFSLPAYAVEVVGDLVDQTTTHCTFRLDGGAWTADLPVVGTPKRCEWSVDTVTVGAHNVTARAVKVDPVWGRLESVDAVPLAFSRPGSPGAPSGLTLTP